eukprot:TRINITY_DN18290_c0_g1_i1.p1 TRINITY_DN18290_c0_g1~~TRINITY_DN18290_c0_g1_i1.p1  ORF type:complete len:450 (-),score=111.41 TRINITY_DN18290_c0_g1_i1:658-2007(-)
MKLWELPLQRTQNQNLAFLMNHVTSHITICVGANMSMFTPPTNPSRDNNHNVADKKPQRMANNNDEPWRTHIVASDDVYSVEDDDADSHDSLLLAAQTTNNQNEHESKIGIIEEEEEEQKCSSFTDRELTVLERRRLETIGLVTTFGFNVCLLALKVVITVLSSSIVLLASMIDSLLDVFTTIILYFAQTLSRKTQYNFQRYPVGRTRVQPVGIIIFAAMMAMASVEIISEAVTTLIAGLKGNVPNFDVGVVSIMTFCSIIAVKLGLYLLCRYLQKKYSSGAQVTESSSLDTLCQDHLNDVLSNSFSIVVAVFASKYRGYIWFLDPVGAIGISILIIKGWIAQGKEHVDHLIGVSAPSETIDHLKEVALAHDERIKAVDSLLAYNLGDNLIVECHIVLSPTMKLEEAHDIGESLEVEFESSYQIERAFVHLDYVRGHQLEHSSGLLHLQ